MSSLDYIDRTSGARWKLLLDTSPHSALGFFVVLEQFKASLLRVCVEVTLLASLEFNMSKQEAESCRRLLYKTLQNLF